MKIVTKITEAIATSSIIFLMLIIDLIFCVAYAAFFVFYFAEAVCGKSGRGLCK